MGARPYDVTVYGASGFTGQFVAAEAVRTMSGKKIAIAGRNKTKLQKVIEFIQKELGSDSKFEDLGIVVADSSNDDSIIEMCRQSKCVINCVGPFRWYGEQVVRACVEMGTHYVDISGEPEFLQTCQIKYHEEAKKKGVHIVGACGFDSIPADLGLELLRDKFPGELTAAESYIHMFGAGKGNYGTYLTILHSINSKDNLKAQQKAIFKEKLPYIGPRLKLRGPGFSNSENKWFIPFLGADPSVVRRTQLYESEQFNKTPIQYSAYFSLKSLIYLICFVLCGLCWFVMTKFSFGMKLLEKYPRIFTMGAFSRDGPTREEISRSGFKLVFHGKGYSKKPESDTAAGQPDKSMSMKIIGSEPGYSFTSQSVVAAAATLLDDKLRNSGGVITPGSALRDTRYLDRMLERGMKVEVM